MTASASPRCAGSITSPDGFAEQLRSAMPSLRGYARRLTRSDGDDLVQETLVRAWRARNQFQPGTNFKAWLSRIARNCFLSDVRRSVRHVEWNPVAHDRLLVSPPLQEEQFYRLDLALAALPVGQREALLLITSEGLSYEQAARRLDQQLGTLKSRVARARAAVTAFLAEGGAPTRSEPTVVADDAEVQMSIYERWKGGRLPNDRLMIRGHDIAAARA